LFLNYCDFSIDTGYIYLSQGNFLKILRDSGLFDSKFTKNQLSLIISKEFTAPSNQIKNLTFDQFLNLTLRISEFKDPVKYKVNPKSVLLGLLNNHMMPLITCIEQAAEQNDELALSNLRSLYTVSDASLKTIVFDLEVRSIF